jgi:hypothetical protein
MAAFSVCFGEIYVLREVDMHIVFDHPSPTGSVIEQSVEFLLVVVDGLASVFADECDKPVTHITVVCDDIQQKFSEIVGSRLFDQ